jgi:hypothetical protein
MKSYEQAASGAELDGIAPTLDARGPVVYLTSMAASSLAVVVFGKVGIVVGW